MRRLLKLTQSPTPGVSLGPLVCGANKLRLRLGRALRCAAQETCALRLRLRLSRALRCAALRKKLRTCDCDCEWAEPCASLRKKSGTCDCDCDSAEPYTALRNEHSEQARAPHTNGPRDVPRCEALSLLQMTLHYKRG